MPRVNREKVKQNEGVDLFLATTTRILVGFNKYKHGQGALYAGLPQQQLIISTMG